MRQERTVQASIFDSFAGHEIGRTRATLAYLRQAAARLGRAADPPVARWQRQVRHYQPLIEQIITQTERRVLAGEPVPAAATRQAMLSI